MIYVAPLLVRPDADFHKMIIAFTCSSFKLTPFGRVDTVISLARRKSEIERGVFNSKLFAQNWGRVGHAERIHELFTR